MPTPSMATHQSYLRMGGHRSQICPDHTPHTPKHHHIHQNHIPLQIHHLPQRERNNPHSRGPTRIQPSKNQIQTATSHTLPSDTSCQDPKTVHQSWHCPNQQPPLPLLWPPSSHRQTQTSSQHNPAVGFNPRPKPTPLLHPSRRC